MKFWGITKAVCGNHSGKTFKPGIDVKVFKDGKQQDTDDGLLFMHTHSLWEALNAVEKFYECTIYGVLELQEVEEHLAMMYDHAHSTFSKQELLEAISYAYDKVDTQEYEIYIETINDYLTANKQGGQDAS